MTETPQISWKNRIFDHMKLKSSIRWQSERKLFGKPLVNIAWGPDASKGEKFGHAKGIIAIGQMASGIIAIGVLSYGIISIGMVSLGLVSFSVLVCFGFLSFSSFAIGLVAFGGAAIGIVALGGMAIGYVAIGGLSIGVYAIGGFAIGNYIISATHTDPESIEFFTKHAPWILKSLGVSK